MWVSAALLQSSGGAHERSDPLLQPIEPEYAKRWLVSQPPARIYGNTFLVGFAGLNVALIRTRSGLILIDGSVPQGVAALERNIRSLGFDPKDIKLILSTEPHWDHAGGLAALARDTGAVVVAAPAAAEVLRRGRSAADDPQAAWLAPYPAVARVRSIAGGKTLRLGEVTVTAVATPGHTPGSMSWTWDSCEAGRCVRIVFGASLRPIAAESYRFSSPARASALAAFRRSFATLRTISCGILLTAHPDQSGGDLKFAQLQRQRDPNPFLDPVACRAYADRYERLLDKRLADEAAGSF
ncbi:subclass B3 metallo-beta-lactamase [Sphingosinicella sp. BN140058]|nr:subclass B3 metallo-beta-lactamase [Sphingosinicella sp. BN140058]